MTARTTQPEVTERYSETETETATSNPVRVVDLDARRSAYRRARDHTTETETRYAAPDSTDSDDGAASATKTEKARAAVAKAATAATGTRATVRRVFGPVSPPDLWTKRRPALRDVRDYAREGQWTDTDTISRRAGKAYAYLVSIPMHATAYATCWWLERPARALLTLVAVIVLLLTGPGQWIAGGLAWFLHALADLIVL